MQENFDFKLLRRGDKMNGNAGSGQLGEGEEGAEFIVVKAGDPRPEGGQRFYSTIISGTRGVKNGVKGCLKQHLFTAYTT
jgi:hypothetical protein